MKALFRTILTVACTAICALSFTACSGKSTQLGAPAEVKPLTYQDRQTQDYIDFKGNVEKFAASFAGNAYTRYGGENFAVSPISVFMALSLAAECANGNTRDELLSAMGVSYRQLEENFSLLYRTLEVQYKHGRKVASELKLTNSIWVNEGMQVNSSCIDALSNKYFAYSYSADFENDNSSANKAVQKFVKDQTKGLIDRDFELSDETIFALINTLYLKAVWNDDGDDLPLTGSKYAFTNADGSVENTKLLQGYYKLGKAYNGEKFKAFFTSTYGGYKIKFMVPNEGYALSDVFTAENIAFLNSLEYPDADDVNRLRFFTRCLFPEYKCAFDNDISAVLKENYGIDLFFKDPGIFSPACELSTLTEEEGYCKKIRHVTDLTVDKKGIEGAAVTVIEFDGATSPAPEEYEEVYEDFVVDKSFGFIITDHNDVTLFSGTVGKI